MSMPPYARNENPDHELLSNLAREDPEAFEKLRQALVGELIERAPEPIQRRLRGVQFKVDIIRLRSSNSLGATVKIYQMMWRSFLQLRHELTTFRTSSDGPRQTARILDFRPRKHLSAM